MKLQYIPPDPELSPHSPDFSFDNLAVSNDYVDLFIHLDPSCAYKLRITMSFKEMLGQASPKSYFCCVYFKVLGYFVYCEGF